MLYYDADVDARRTPQSYLIELDLRVQLGSGGPLAPGTCGLRRRGLGSCGCHCWQQAGQQLPRQGGLARRVAPGWRGGGSNGREHPPLQARPA